MKSFSFDAKELSNDLDVIITVKRLTEMKIRWNIAKWLLELACKIGNFTLEIEQQDA